MKKVPLPEWCVSVKKAMVERDDMSVTELAVLPRTRQPGHQWYDGAVCEHQVRD